MSISSYDCLDLLTNVLLGVFFNVYRFYLSVSGMPLKSASVDRIVCDAPFGQKFAVASCSLPQFYKKLMQEMYRYTDMCTNRERFEIACQCLPSRGNCLCFCFYVKGDNLCHNLLHLQAFNP